jgi:hypothetical protein
MRLQNKGILLFLFGFIIPFSERKGYMAKIRIKIFITFVCLSQTDRIAALENLIV